MLHSLEDSFGHGILFLFIYCWILFVYILRIFWVYILYGFWPIVFFYSNIFVWFCYLSNTSIIDWVSLFSSHFCNRLCRIGTISSSSFSLEFTSKALWIGAFFIKGFQLYFKLSTEIFSLFICFWVSLCHFVFQIIYPFYIAVKIIGRNSFIIFIYYNFLYHQWRLPFILGIGNLLLSITRSLLVLLIFL